MSVIQGDLEQRVMNFALNSLDRKALLRFTLIHLEGSIDNYACEKTLDLFQEVCNFVNTNTSKNALDGFAVRQLIEVFKAYPSSGNGDFSSELMKLGSTISILYCQQHDDELVREFVSFLFSLSENSGAIPEGMPSHTSVLYLKVLCNYTVRALNEYCTVKGY